MFADKRKSFNEILKKQNINDRSTQEDLSKVEKMLLGAIEKFKMVDLSYDELKPLAKAYLMQIQQAESSSDTKEKLALLQFTLNCMEKNVPKEKKRELNDLQDRMNTWQQILKLIEQPPTSKIEKNIDKQKGMIVKELLDSGVEMLKKSIDTTQDGKAKNALSSLLHHHFSPEISRSKFNLFSSMAPQAIDVPMMNANPVQEIESKIQQLSSKQTAPQLSAQKTMSGDLSEKLNHIKDAIQYLKSVTEPERKSEVGVDVANIILANVRWFSNPADKKILLDEVKNKYLDFFKDNPPALKVLQKASAEVEQELAARISRSGFSPK